MKTALITGVTGQDGSFLVEFLLAKGYEVHGIVRRASTFNTGRLARIYADPHESGSRFHLHYGDMTDASCLRHILEKTQPDEIYNLAAQSHVRVSFDQSEYTADVVAMGTLRLLEAYRDHVRTLGRRVRFYQAGSSEMFGAAKPPQAESTPVLSAQPVRRQQSGRPLVLGQLPRSLRPVHLQRHPLQPRVGAPRRDLRDA